jgi:hypothetical protein
MNEVAYEVGSYIQGGDGASVRVEPDRAKDKTDFGCQMTK